MKDKIKQFLQAVGRPFGQAWKAIKPQRKRVTKFLKPYFKNWGLWFICLGLIVAAQATLIWAPKVGVYMNAVALAGLAVVALRKPVARTVAISMAIIPAANMATASFMLHTNLGRTVVMYAVMLSLTLVYRFMFTLKFPEFSTRLLKHGYAFGLPLMVVLGQLIGVIAYVFLRNHYPYTGYSLPLIALAAIVFAFTEEMLLRGLIQQCAEGLFHPIVAAITSAVLYVFLAVDSSVMLTLPVAILMGCLLSFIYHKKKNLLLTVTLNATAKLTYIGLVAAFILR